MYLVLIYIILIFLLLITDRQLEGQGAIIKISFIYEGKSIGDSNKGFSENTTKIILPFDINTSITDVISKLITKNNSIPSDEIELLYDSEKLESTVLKKSFKNSSGVIVYPKLSQYLDSKVTDITVKVISNMDFISNGGVESPLLKDIDDGKKDISKIYSEFVKSYLKNNKKKKDKHMIKYSNKITSIFKKKYKYNLLTSNSNKYIDDPGSPDDPGYIPGTTDSSLLPSRKYNIIKSDSIDESVSIDESDESDKCCNKVGFKIENTKLLQNTLPLFTRSLMYEDSSSSYDPYNLNYYDEMETGGNKYKYLLGSMKNINDPGNLSYK